MAWGRIFVFRIFYYYYFFSIPYRKGAKIIFKFTLSEIWQQIVKSRQKGKLDEKMTSFTYKNENRRNWKLTKMIKIKNWQKCEIDKNDKLKKM